MITELRVVENFSIFSVELAVASLAFWVVTTTCFMARAKNLFFNILNFIFMR
jgi:hypothetical protein